MKVAFTGDWALTFSESLSIDNLEADFVLGNLEAPLSISRVKRPKGGPHLQALKKHFKENIFPANCYFALCNNHIMDYGDEGLTETRNTLEKLNCKYFGAGNMADASRPLILEYDDLKVAIIGAAESQYGVVSDNQSGVRPYNLSELISQINSLKGKVDFIILSIHSGSEMYALPYPKLQKDFRLLIDLGVDIIHGHHSHIPLAYEVYNNKYIFYGLGNFIADPKIWKTKLTRRSLVPIVDFRNGGQISVKLSFSEIQHSVESVTIKIEKNCLDLKSYFSEINEVLDNSKFLSKMWQEHSVQLFEEWYGISLRYSLKNFSFYQKLKLSFKQMLRREIYKYKYLEDYHYFSCDSHKYAIETALGVLSKEIVDARDEFSKNMYLKIKDYANQV